MGSRLSICSEFADLLEYPVPQLRARTDTCISRLDPLDADAAALLRQFRRDLEPMRDGPLQEAYTASFDMQKDHCLYVGHHLFGEDCRRNLFLSMLQKHYDERGFSSGSELPDYLPAILRFAAGHEREPDTTELLIECVIPALRKMAAPDDFYAPLLRAALHFLTAETS